MPVFIRRSLPHTREHHTHPWYTDNITKSSQSLRCISSSGNGGTTKYDTTCRTWCVHDMLVSKRFDVWTVSWCSVESWRTERLFWYQLHLGGTSSDNSSCRIYPNNKSSFRSFSFDLCQSLSISVDLCQSRSLISVDLCRSQSISVDLCQSWSISVDLCWSLLISVNLCRSLSISVIDLCRSRSI